MFCTEHQEILVMGILVDAHVDDKAINSNKW